MFEPSSCSEQEHFSTETIHDNVYLLNLQYLHILLFGGDHGGDACHQNRSVKQVLSELGNTPESLARLTSKISHIYICT